MTRINLFRTNRALAAGAIAAGVCLLAAFQRADTVQSRTTGGYTATFQGNGAEGRDMIWVGSMSGDLAGEVTIRLASEGPLTELSNPVWPVEGIVFVSGEPARSFAADVHGTIDWQKHAVQLTGAVTVGYHKGARFEQTAEIRDLNLTGEVAMPFIVASR